MARQALFPLLFCLLLMAPSSASARDFIRIVGSSTVFPFAAVVAEEFSLKTPYPTPIIEPVGTGGGLKLFCAGLGTSGRYDYPDIANASRRIKPNEIQRCHDNGVEDFLEIKIGFDGIAVVHARQKTRFNLTLRQLYLALAKFVPSPDISASTLVENPYQRWDQIDPSLPNQPILMYAPPASSGTKDAFIDAVFDVACQAPETSADQKKRARCQELRTDGLYVEAGENDNVIVQRLLQNPEAVGILPYAIVNQNASILQASAINAVVPTTQTIANGQYRFAREMFLYIKPQHTRAVPGLTHFLAEFLSENAMGQYGYLQDKGFVALPPKERRQSRERVQALTKLAPISIGSEGDL